MNAPFFSVVIPVRNGGAEFAICLKALAGSNFRSWELIVVDDGSRDASASLAEEWGAILLHSANAGPAYARNTGAAAAQGSYLFFLDADCAVQPNTLGLAANILQAEPTLDALFGSYDDSPAAQNLISQYKNLQHHYVHQTSKVDASTFWTGCGCVKRDLFLRLGGFDAARYPHPSIEDIEFGIRLKAGGGRIRLAKEVQVKHLKHWRWRSWLATDTQSRAVPWVRLLVEQTDMIPDLNLQWPQRISGVCVLCLLTAFIWRPARPIVSLLIGLLLGLNAGFYRFLWRKRGLRFTLTSIPLHWLYYLYSTMVFVIVVLDSKRRR